MKTFTLFILMWCVPLLLVSQDHGHKIKPGTKVWQQSAQGSELPDALDPVPLDPNFGVQVKGAIQTPQGDNHDFRIKPGCLILNPDPPGLVGIESYDPFYNRAIKAIFTNPHERKKPKKINPYYHRPGKTNGPHRGDSHDFRIKPGCLILNPEPPGLVGIESYDPFFHRAVKAIFTNPHERKNPKKINPFYHRPGKTTGPHRGHDFTINPTIPKSNPTPPGGGEIETAGPKNYKVVAVEKPHGDKTSPKKIDPLYHRPDKNTGVHEKLADAWSLKPGVQFRRIDQEPEMVADSEIGWMNNTDNDPYTHRKAPESFLVPERDRGVVSIVELGSAANIFTYGEQNGALTYTWYNQELNALTNVHRMGGEVGPPGQYSGDLCYDVSYDQGQSWVSQIKVYESNVSGGEYNIDAARFPQAAIYNPNGNTTISNAYLAFFAANLDGTNGGDWGGYSYGMANLGSATDTTKHLQSSDLPNGYYQGIPSAFTITREDNVAVMADASLLDSYTEYLGDFIFMRGTFDDGPMDYVYDKFLVPVEAEYARYLKMAFDPSGQIGYIYWNNVNGSIPYMDEWLYPLIIKTEDGGENWSEVISIELGGPDGIETIKNWLPDEVIQSLWEAPYPARDEIMYASAWWNTDIAVDAWGNPHLAAAIYIAGPGVDPGYVITTPETFGIFDLYSIDDDNQQWQALHLGTLNVDHVAIPNGSNPDMEEYNRLEVASSWDGTKMFFSWADTRLEGVEDNSSPDIYARGFDLEENALTYDESSTAVAGATCVTAFSEAMWQAYFKSMAHYVITNGEDYTLPLFYVDMNPLNALDPVRFKYIQDFSWSDGDFTLPTGNPPITTTGYAEAVLPEGGLILSQNYPNPFTRQSTVTVTVDAPSDLSFRVFNQVGQALYDEVRTGVEPGNHQFDIIPGDWKPGVYYYAVTNGSQVQTRKMIIQ